MTWHRWTGAVCALFLAIQGLSGALLVFRDTIEAGIHPELISAPSPQRASAQAMYDAVAGAHPDAKIARAEFPEDPDRVVLFRLKEQGGDRLVGVDPHTGRIARDDKASGWAVEWVFLLHQTLFAGRTGEIIVGIDGLALLFIVVTGPIVWWPGRKRLAAGLKVRWSGKADLRWRTLHRSAGAIASIVLLVSALTGVGMVWKDSLRDTAATVVPVTYRPAPRIAERPGAERLPLDLLVRNAQRLYPTRLSQIRFLDEGRAIAVFLEGDRSVRADAMNQVYLDGYTGRVIGRYVPGELPPASELFDWLYTVHTGLWLGWPTMVLMVLAGLALCGLALSGPWLWWSRTKLKRRRARTGAQASARPVDDVQPA